MFCIYCCYLLYIPAVQYSVDMTVQGDFTNDLNNPDSDKYKTLKNNVEYEVMYY